MSLTMKTFTAVASHVAPERVPDKHQAGPPPGPA
jgi:hypothetical protein